MVFLQELADQNGFHDSFPDAVVGFLIISGYVQSQKKNKRDHITQHTGERMCQMSIMMEGGDGPELVMENASLLEVTDEGIQVSSLFDPPKLIADVRVVKIDFMNGKVMLDAIDS